MASTLSGIAALLNMSEEERKAKLNSNETQVIDTQQALGSSETQSSAPSAGQISAIGNLVSQVSGDSDTGGAAGGAAQGAAAGSMIAPGVGTAIGAGVGALAGISEARAKRKAKQAQIEATKISNIGQIQQNVGNQKVSTLQQLAQSLGSRR